ncbi:YihY/virulence factor BrkB family protein [Poseidonocella sedimentorum]|uniref:Membrane protein n=1 Tax=Poseidonocella sedimentorum TaxID=871652 RepID=A0A1I6E153_9RHOB|nr:YihY/virulence factor BrkB family protein [Poseidonocella sedimentorum]SFR11415.1 membrane protein [Poseidonocella sedimentorum]
MSEARKKGRKAARPRQIPWRGWFAILKRVQAEMVNDRLTLVAAGVAFYGLLALFPGITALMAIAGLLFDPAQVTAQIETVSSIVPDAAAEIIIGQASSVAGSDEDGLGIAAILGLGLALYSASNGVGSLIQGINLAYDERDSRGFVAGYALRFALTLFLIFGMIIGLAATVILPPILQLLSLGPAVEMVIGLLRWVALTLIAMLGLGVLYRFAPCREPANWRWLTPGAVIATVLWLAASVGFSIYVSNFASYQETFGAIAGVVILLVWLWISALLILIGAEINAESEAETRVDTTTGTPMPMGARGAVKADTLAE